MNMKDLIRHLKHTQRKVIQSVSKSELSQEAEAMTVGVNGDKEKEIFL